MLSPHGVKGTGAQIGQVLALHPLWGIAPYMLSEQNNSSNDAWADNIGGWLGGDGSGSEPAHDPDNLSYYLDSELVVMMTFDGGSPFMAYHSINKVNKHSGVSVYNEITANDLSLPGTPGSTGSWSTYLYTLDSGGTPHTSGVFANMDTAAHSVVMALPPYWPYPNYGGEGYTMSTYFSAALSSNSALYAISVSASGVGLPDKSWSATYSLNLSNPWGGGDVQGALDTLLSQINLSNPAQKYHIYEDATRAVLSYRALNPAGESVTVTYDGLSEGVPLAVVIISNGVWNWSPPQWMALNMNDATYCIVNGVLPPYGEAGVPGAIGDADSNDASGLVGSGRPWAKIKSMVLIPAGSFTKTIFSYQQPQADTVGYTAYHAGTPLNNYPGAELLGRPTYAITGGNWYYFSPGAWISLTKAS